MQTDGSLKRGKARTSIAHYRRIFWRAGSVANYEPRDLTLALQNLMKTDSTVKCISEMFVL